MRRSPASRPGVGDSSPELTELPELFDLRVKARALAYLFSAGAALAALSLVLPHDESVRDLQLWVVVGVALAISVLLYWAADRILEWQVHLALAAGITLISFANYYSTPTLFSPLYTWAALYAFYFFGTGPALAQLVYIGVAYGVELAVRDAPSPETRWLLGVGTPLVAGLLVVRMLDRLRAGRAEADERARELRESEARTRLVLDSAPDAFVTLDAEGVIRNWNHAAERVFGWSAAEAIGEPMRTLVTPPELRDRHDERRQALVDSLGPEAPTRYEVELVRRDGSRFPAEATVSKVDVRGEILLAGFIRDVTDRKRQQDEREALVRE
jgi:PAS domain S-box-containing protein